ncbi:MAG: PKD domain-containing protein [Thermoplasmata archaeon]|nr:MAG: PKD domain-containing protein [Thermoplasmata archaeon]
MIQESLNNKLLHKDKGLIMNKAVVITLISIIFFTLFPGCLSTENIPPEPNLRASSTFLDVNETVTFFGNDSFDRDGEIVRYFWDFDDGTNDTGKYVSHEYEEGGNYTVILIITDDDNRKAVQAITIHVNELPVPVIDISLPAYIHEEVFFKANDSYDLDGFITDYYWDFGDGANETGMSVSHIFDTFKGDGPEEMFKVTLTVTDNDGAKGARTKDFLVKFRTYEVSWGIGTLIKGGDEGSLEEGNSEIISREIKYLNLTKVEFTLTWEDFQPYYGSPPLPVGEPNDEFILNITSPNGYYYEGGPDTDEKIVVKVPSKGAINPIPSKFTMKSESPKILETLIVDEYTSNNGTGEWEINITLTEALGTLGGPPDLDPGEDWILEDIICYYYYPDIKIVEE